MPATPPAPRRTGRPARISRDQIATAALEIGLADLTLRAVADRLGVSVAALYHHIDGRDDLMRLAADHSATRLRLPEDNGQHWSVWLLEWATYNHDAFVADPALLEQFLDGAISPEVIARNTEQILAVLVRQGFTVTEAQAAYALVIAVAIGSAVTAIRDRRAVERGDPTAGDALRALAEEAPGELPHLRALVAAADPDPDARFAERLRPALIGIALAHGDDPAVIDQLFHPPTTRAR